MLAPPPSSQRESNERIQVRLHGEPGAPALIYLPGLHGDWTLVSSFRVAISPHVRFVEATYPRTLTWSLQEHAAAIRDALIGHGITRAWLLGESFGSQIVWPLLTLSDEAFRVDGVVLAGGFVRHPLPWLVHGAEWCSTRWPRWFLRSALWVYERCAGFRHRQAPETRASVPEFVARRLEPLDRLAIHHRLGLIVGSDWRAVAATTQVPVFLLVGGIDPVVPVPPVWRWLRRHCPGYRGGRVIWRADHNVLGTEPGRAAEQIRRWMNSEGSVSGGRPG